MEVLLLLGRLAIFTGLGVQRPWTGDLRGGKGRNRVDFGNCRRIARIRKQSHESSQGNPCDKNLKNSSSKPARNNNGEISSTAETSFLFTGLLADRIFTCDGVFSPEKVVEATHLNELPVKKVVTGIKTADLLLKGIKAVHGVMILLEAQGGNLSALGSPDGIVLGLKAVKVVIKGVKMSHKALKSRGVNSLGFGDRFKDMVNGMKASWGAMDLVRGSKAIWSEIFSGRVAAVNLFLRGYEASRGALSTVEALNSLKFGFVSALAKGVTGAKAALSGIGVMIKAWMVSKELYVFLIKGLGLSHGAREVLKIISEGREREELKVSLKLKPAEKGIKQVRFSRKQVDGLSWTDGGESWSEETRVMTSLITCLSAYQDARRFHEHPHVVWFSIQGLRTEH